MTTLEDLLDHLQEVIERLEARGPEVARDMLELLDGLEGLHRHAVQRLTEEVGRERMDAAADQDPAARWLLSTYGAIDDPALAEEALGEIRPYVHSHGGEVEVLEVRSGRVRVRLTGNCAGCTASDITLRHGVEEVLRDHLPGFRGLEVEEDDAEAHPPPGPTLLDAPQERRSLPIVPG
ncbi:MAG: NifU family protein [Actinobacteria bacterium]|nr:NifU family protein [Actinomycetota bacterium]